MRHKVERLTVYTLYTRKVTTDSLPELLLFESLLIESLLIELFFNELLFWLFHCVTFTPLKAE